MSYICNSPDMSPSLAPHVAPSEVGYPSVGPIGSRAIIPTFLTLYYPLLLTWSIFFLLSSAAIARVHARVTCLKPKDGENFGGLHKRLPNDVLLIHITNYANGKFCYTIICIGPVYMCANMVASTMDEMLTQTSDHTACSARRGRGIVLR